MRPLTLAAVVVLVATLNIQQTSGQTWKLDDGKVVFEKKPEKPRTPSKKASNGNFGLNRYRLIRVFVSAFVSF